MPLEGEEIGRLIARAVEASASERRPWYEAMEKLPQQPLIDSTMLREFDTLVVEVPDTRRLASRPPAAFGPAPANQPKLLEGHRARERRPVGFNAAGHFDACCTPPQVKPRQTAGEHWRQAQRLSRQLHAAQDRIAELEAEVRLYREKAERAEVWLSRISNEIEDRLSDEPEERAAASLT